MSKSLKLWAIALVLWLPVSAASARTVIWDKNVLPIELVVGVEQLVHFEGEVAPGLTPLLSKKDFFRVLSSNGTVYMTAMQAFPAQRVKFRTASGEFVLADISAKAVKTPPKNVEALHIVSKAAGDARRTTEAGFPGSHRNPRQGADGVTMFDVIRYGAQTLYSPARVIKPVPGISDVPIKIRNDLRGLYKGSDSRQLSIKAVKGWRSNGNYVTALKISNLSNQAMRFDPSKLQHTMKGQVNGVNNQFEAVALLNHLQVLSPRKQRGSDTYVLVVTLHPFTSVLDI
jgi:integrating conjugative element protein (TIGR03749 family)